MPSRCIFFFSALRAWSTLLSRTRTCTHALFVCAKSVRSEWDWRRGRKRRRHLGALSTRMGDESPLGCGPAPSIGQEARDVPHLAARAHRDLAVEVHGGARNGQPFSVIVDLVADQIDHFDPALADGLRQRPAGPR